MEIKCRVYRPRRPRESPLFRLVEQRLEELLRVWPQRFAGTHGSLRPVIERVLGEFLKCGLLEHGFARLWCSRCRRSVLVAFSCRGRSFRPCCEKKKQLLWAEWLRDELLAPVPHRHVVLTIQCLLRPLFRRRRELLVELARAAPLRDRFGLVKLCEAGASYNRPSRKPAAARAGGGMRRTLVRIDTLLRGGFTQREVLRDGRVDVAVHELSVAAVPLGVAYGLFMGLYAVMRGGPGSGLQLLATALKVPLLFLLTLLVTLPSLYVLSALARSRLSFTHTVRLLLAAVTVNLALLASLGPVTAFFTLSTESYPFMILLNVVFFAVSGLVGLVFLRKALDVVFEPEPMASSPSAGGAPVAGTVAAQALHGIPRQDPAGRVFNAWTLIYSVVGAQMGWILRPFIGAPSEPFQWFRERQSNFFVVVWESFLRLF